jgi:hypothetical protein
MTQSVAKLVELPDRMKSVEEALEAAREQNPRVIIAVGINENGEEFDHCSYADLPTLLWLLERAKARLIA